MWNGTKACCSKVTLSNLIQLYACRRSDMQDYSLLLKLHRPINCLFKDFSISVGAPALLMSGSQQCLSNALVSILIINIMLYLWCVQTGFLTIDAPFFPFEGCLKTNSLNQFVFHFYCFWINYMLIQFLLFVLQDFIETWAT